MIFKRSLNSIFETPIFKSVRVSPTPVVKSCSDCKSKSNSTPLIKSEASRFNCDVSNELTLLRAIDSTPPPPDKLSNGLEAKKRPNTINEKTCLFISEGSVRICERALLTLLTTS
ncbi:hypothetical protein D3C87_1819140 [compost metagenome]